MVPSSTIFFPCAHLCSLWQQQCHFACMSVQLLLDSMLCFDLILFSQCWLLISPTKAHTPQRGQSRLLTTEVVLHSYSSPSHHCLSPKAVYTLRWSLLIAKFEKGPSTTSATSAYSSLGVSLSVAKSGACCTDGSDCNVFLKCRSQLIVGLWDYTFYKTLTAKSLQNYLKQTMNIIFIKSVLLWSWNMYYATLLGNWPHRKASSNGNFGQFQPDGDMSSRGLRRKKSAHCRYHVHGVYFHGVSWQGKLESHACKKYFHLSTVINIDGWECGTLKLWIMSKYSVVIYSKYRSEAG